MNRLRSWATPITTGAFTLIAITGLAMLFHVKSGFVKPIHEWMSLVLVAAVVLHVVVNWRGLLLAVKRPRGTIVVAAFVAITVAALIPSSGPAGGPPQRRALEALLDAPLTVAAPVAGKSAEELAGALARRGMKVEDGNASMREIARSNGAEPMEMLKLAFQ